MSFVRYLSTFAAGVKLSEMVLVQTIGQFGLCEVERRGPVPADGFTEFHQWPESFFRQNIILVASTE